MTALTLMLACAAAPATLRASDPIGVYAVVDRVQVTTGGGGEAVAQVWGSFVLAVNPEVRPYPASEGYGKAATGYLLFRCPADKRATCAAEWNDLTSVAGKKEIVGFGRRWEAAPRVRPNTEAPSAPDTYAINVGVAKLGKYGDYPEIAAALSKLAGH